MIDQLYLLDDYKDLPVEHEQVTIDDVKDFISSVT
jgi:hypothetical protein